ncbi:DUF2784 domain-containing protein [Pararhodonellum marinum]|uniref:DUF2784 domain-containing protein n=1 Tax=Pararhodonellum marinum TaxID=2755358 RepID=UPI00188DC6C5|nr:DUF2784 domain-containing protein [Pararhodonellum marinum]
MSETFLNIADIFFVVFHSVLVLFNLFAWIWRPLRKWHLWTIGLTLGSWVVLGYWYGWGYCPLTDWHWDILREKGVKNLPNSYISYLLQRLLGLHLPDQTVDILTVGTTLTALVASIWINFWRKN